MNQPPVVTLTRTSGARLRKALGLPAAKKGKPSKGTKKDKRLKVNKRGK